MAGRQGGGWKGSRGHHASEIWKIPVEFLESRPDHLIFTVRPVVKDKQSPAVVITVKADFIQSQTIAIGKRSSVN